MTASPDFKIYLNGTEIPQKERMAVSRILIDEHLNVASRFRIFFFAKDFKNIFENDNWTFGIPLQIGLGYALKGLTSLILGEIISIQTVYGHQGAYGVITGYDHLIETTRTYITKTYQKMKASAIVEQIATEIGLGVGEIKDTKVSHSYLIQNNQTNYDFLTQLANANHYELFVRDQKLYFHPPKIDADPVLDLLFHRGSAIDATEGSGDLPKYNLMEFNANFSSRYVYKDVTVTGWNPASCQSFTGKASFDKLIKKLGKDDGSKISSNIGDPGKVIVDVPIGAQDEADAHAVAIANQEALKLITGDAVCEGTPLIRAGKIVNIKGVSQKFNGPYYIDSTEHDYNIQDGNASYETRFTFKRNAYNPDA